MGAVAALGGFGGLAVLVPVLTGMLGGGQPDATPSGSATRASSEVSSGVSSARREDLFVTFEQPAARGDAQVEIGLCPEFRGRSRLADGYRLWLVGRVATEDAYTLFGEAKVSATTGTWNLKTQVGAEEQTGAVFEIFAVPVPVRVSDYLLDATDYQGRHLAPHGDGTSMLGLRNTALPPDADTRHGDSITVRRSEVNGC
ncbi:hypothetical protein ABZX85_14125 [Streptomyces sp. NPDC004539]|uniref:hypothetical protein n=1 Tax=Streptomyces sp. NPDC004539 TaxID=3154280 RepID=UPI0033A159B1